jgi:hypothetical protein
MSDLLARVSTQHPRLLGTKPELQAMAKERPDAYARTAYIARNQQIGDKQDDHRMSGKIPSMALVAAIEGDQKLSREAVDLALERFIDRPVRVGHVPFGADVAFCSIIYDLCYESWTDDERRKFYAYMTECRARNMNEEPSLFHNGWYAYKMWGFGLGCLTTLHENPAASAMYLQLDQEIRERASPALDFAGDGGGWGEGYYVHYWTYEWFFFCQAAFKCAGIDYFALAPKFYKNRALASMFEMYPTLQEAVGEAIIQSPSPSGTIGLTRKPVPMGDGGGRTIHPERDKALISRRILVNHYRDDATHQAVHAFNLTTPQVGFPYNACRDFLFHDPKVKAGDLKSVKLSHFSPGPGYVYARESWNEDSAYLFFRSGKRFTSHQHLDNGYFVLFKHEELLGDGGHYDSFNSDHTINYYLRSVAHNTMLIHDPAEKFPNFIRAAGAAANDGGQKYPWVGTPWRHNGSALDVEHWKENPELGDLASITAYNECGDYMYTAGDCTKAYSETKLAYFTRQIVFVRPGTFVIFDRVKSTNANFRKTFLLQAMKPPAGNAPNLVITNGKGRLFVQTVLPAKADVRLMQGDQLYTYDGQSHNPSWLINPAPECRIEVSPTQPSEVDYFLHVLTTTDSGVQRVPQANATVKPDEISVTIAETKIGFQTQSVGGWIELGGRKRPL